MVGAMTELKSTEAVFQHRTDTSFAFKMLFFGVVALTWGAGFVAEFTNTGTGIFGGPMGVIVLVLVSVLVLFLTLSYSQITVRGDSIELRWFPLYKRTFRRNEIGETVAVKLPLLKYGVGLRFYGGGDLGLIARSGQGVYVPLVSKGGYYVSVQSERDAEAVAEVLRQFTRAD